MVLLVLSSEGARATGRCGRGQRRRGCTKGEGTRPLTMATARNPGQSGGCLGRDARRQWEVMALSVLGDCACESIWEGWLGRGLGASVGRRDSKRALRLWCFEVLLGRSRFATGKAQTARSVCRSKGRLRGDGMFGGIRCLPEAPGGDGVRVTRRGEGAAAVRWWQSGN